MTSKEKQAQEFYSLRYIPDSFKKIVITGGMTKANPKATYACINYGEAYCLKMEIMFTCKNR